MATYDFIAANARIYQGNSFSRGFYKSDGSIWEANETGEFEMFNSGGTVVASGAMAHSADNLSMGFHVPDTATPTLLGVYIVLAVVTDTGDATVNAPLAEYTVTVSEKKAP